MIQLDKLKLGFNQIFSEAELIKKLERKQPLRIKLGFDPTAPDLHLGHMVLLRKLRQFQNLGHEAVIIIGDFTARIGDPTGRSSTRPILNKNDILNNSDTYLQQVFKILDSDKTTVLFNSSWLDVFRLSDALHLMAHSSVAQMLQRDDFSKRFNNNENISLHEFIYPLLQAQDSVVVAPDIELGGTDQTFNLLLGRQLMVAEQMEPQVCMTMPILEGTDGTRKMSKSFNNYIGIAEDPNDIFGKIMSIPDTLMPKYYELLSNKTIIEQNECGIVHPRELKINLAVDIVCQLNGEEIAKKAFDHFDNVCVKKNVPEQMPVHKLDNGKIWLPSILAEVGFVASSSKGRQLIQQNGVKINSKTVSDESVVLKDGDILQCGKLKFVKIII